MRQIKVTQSVTYRTDAFDRYTASIKRKKLTAEQEVALVKIFRANPGSVESQKAKEELIRCNLLFVISIAKKYEGSIPLLDLIQEGNEGLSEAIDRFDETKGFKLISYAVWWIRQRISLAIANDKTTVRLPVNAIKSESTPKRLMISLNEKMQLFDEDFEILDTMESVESLTEIEQPLDKEGLSKELQEALDSVHPKRRKKFIIMRYGLGDASPMTVEEIAKAEHITRENVRIQIKKGLLQMREAHGDALMQFL